MIGLLFALAAEPPPTPKPDAAPSPELLEYLGGLDTAPAWVRDDPPAPPATDAASPPTQNPKRNPAERRQ